MNIEQVLDYVEKHNLNKKSNKRVIVDRRNYVIAYMYHILKIHNLSTLGTMLGNRNHATIINSLKNAHSLKDDNEFVINTIDIRSYIEFDIPPYISVRKTQELEIDYSRQTSSMCVTIKLQKKEFVEYLKTQDQTIVLNAFVNMIIQKHKRI